MDTCATSLISMMHCQYYLASRIIVMSVIDTSSPSRLVECVVLV